MIQSLRYDAEAKSAQEMTKALFDGVVATGGMNYEAQTLQALMNQGASATDTMTISMANSAITDYAN